LAQALERYQVEAIASLLRSPDAIPIRVREFEFLAPTGEAARLEDEGVHPFLEVEAAFAAPLLELRRAGRISTPSWDPRPGHRLQAEVAVLAGRFDQAVDYRTAIALAHGYPNHLLFLADDNISFTALRADGTDVRLVRAFLGHGAASPEMRAALGAAEAHRSVIGRLNGRRRPRMKSPQAEKAAKDKNTVKAIVEVASSIEKRIEARGKPEVTFPIRSLGNVHYDPKKGWFEIGKGKSIRTLTVNTAKTFAQTLKMMALSKELVETATSPPSETPTTSRRTGGRRSSTTSPNPTR
jgi:hypothetical protein